MKASEIGLPQELDDLGVSWRRLPNRGVYAAHKSAVSGAILWDVVIYKWSSYGAWSKPEVSVRGEILCYKDIEHMERVVRAVSDAVEKHNEGK